MSMRTSNRPEKDGLTADMMSLARRVGLSIRPVFHDPQAFLASVNLDSFVKTWWERHLHAGLSEAARHGAAIGKRDMAEAAVGLFKPQYYHFANADWRKIEQGRLYRFLSDVLARNPRPKFANDVAKAIEVATANLRDPAGGKGLGLHAAGLESTRQRYPIICRSAVLGEFGLARHTIETIADPQARDRLIHFLAMQRIVWAAADVHRIAARGRHAERECQPWFMRPFLKSNRASAYSNLLENMAAKIERLFATADRGHAVDPDATNIVFRGKKGTMLLGLILIGERLRGDLTHEETAGILSMQNLVRQGAADMRDRLIEMRSRPGWSEQQTIHQRHTAGLSEVACLFVTAYRFAQDEAKMLDVMRQPEKPDALWDVRPNPWPTAIAPALATRARHMVAAYRASILCDLEALPYASNNIRLAEQSEADAHAFMLRRAQQSDEPLHTDLHKISRLLDLSHQYRRA